MLATGGGVVEAQWLGRKKVNGPMAHVDTNQWAI